MLYLDTSCLLKLLRMEPESSAERAAVENEEQVVISSLAELESEVQLKAAAMGGEIRTSQWRQYQAKLVAIRNFDPFQFFARVSLLDGFAAASASASGVLPHPGPPSPGRDGGIET
jgi:uncharacterized protein with PIN domain